MTITDLTETWSHSQASDRLVVDIVVAVHGLYEGALKTWTDSDRGVVWLKDLFPYQQQKARILTYSYTAEALQSPGDGATDRILSFAICLVAELCADRQLAGAFERPIIFVCHGFGGLLVKRALAFSSTRTAQAVEHLRSVYTSTYAILFMGTPHHGINKDALLLPRKEDSLGPSQFMLSMVKGSEMIQEIADQFAPLTKRFCIYNFWEEIKTCAGDTMAYIVDEGSAAPVWDNVERCGIMATHSAMVKFKSSVDPGYRVVLEALVRYTSLAPPLVRSRWQNDRQMLAAERQKEAEVLLQPRLQQIVSESVNGSNITNEWFIVPRASSSYFTGRQMQASQVKEAFGPIRRRPARESNRVFVVHGLGGSGKTQFCLRYVEDNRSRYWGIFWIDASNDENAESGFASLGQQAGKGATCTAGMHWLSTCSKPWLLVIDNADDPDMDVSRYFPAGGAGDILVTTRNPGTTIHATAGHLRFRGMDPEDAVALLLKFASSESESNRSSSQNRELARGIASELGYLALAIAHAGTTIRRNIYTLERYLHYYLGYRKTMLSLPHIKTVDETNIITTWEIPFQRIVNRRSTEHQDAVDLIHIFAFMHFESIPESIFQKSWNASEAPKSLPEVYPDILQIETAWNDEAQARLRRAVRVLCDYSIIDHEPEKGFCSLHPVIHAWARGRLDESEQDRWLSCTTAILAHCISSNLEASGRGFRRLLLPHIDSCLRALKSRHPSLPEDVKQAAHIERFTWVYTENGLWKQACMLQHRIVTFRLKQLGKRHEDTIQAQRGLGYIYWNLFEIRSAIEVQWQVLKSRWWSRPSLAYWATWRPWKPDHITYCLALDDLALTLWLAGKRELSKTAGERAVQGLTKRLGPNDPRTLNAMFNLARTYLHLGEQRTSHELLIWVLKRRRQFFGPEHPETLMTRNELGMNLCLHKQHLAAAERLVRSVLESRQRILGEEHAYTLWSKNDLSKVLCERGRPEEAVTMLEEVMPVVRRTLGEEHVGMFMTKSNIARAYVQSGRWKEAEELLRPLVASVPSDHPDWIHAMSGYAHVLIHLGRLEEAERNCNEVLDAIARTKAVTMDNPRTLAVAEQLLEIYRTQGRVDEIAELKKRVPAMNEGSHGGRFEILPVRRPRPQS